MAERSGSGAPVLLFVPTDLESRLLGELGGFTAGLAVEARCGFGPIAAAACAAAWIERLAPARALLVGIAGTYDPTGLPVGAAALFERVAIDGLETSGFEQIPGTSAVLELAPSSSKSRRDLLVTVLGASRTPAEAAARRERFAGAAAEDMEGYAIALACAQARVPLSIVRGISNTAGDLDKERWRIREALAAARTLALEILRLSGETAAA